MFIVANKTSLTPPLFIEVPVPNHESEYYMCATGIDLTSFNNSLLDCFLHCIVIHIKAVFLHDIPFNVLIIRKSL